MRKIAHIPVVSVLVVAFLLPTVRNSACGMDYEGCFRDAKRCVSETFDIRTEVTFQVVSFDASLNTSYKAVGVCYYDDRSNSVRFDPNRLYSASYNKAKTVAELRAVLVVVFAHELLHAYQAAVLQTIHTTLSEQDLRILREAHAQAFSAVLAEKLGLPIEAALAPPRRPQKFSDDLLERRAQIEAYVSYVMAPEWIRQSLKRPDEFSRLLELKALPYDRFLGIKPATPEQVETGHVLARIEKACGDAEHKGVSFLDTISYLAPHRFDDTALAAAFEGATVIRYTLAEQGCVDTLAVVLRDATQADRLWQDARMFAQGYWQVSDGTASDVSPQMPSPGVRQTWYMDSAGMMVRLSCAGRVVVCMQYPRDANTCPASVGIGQSLVSG